MRGAANTANAGGQHQAVQNGAADEQILKAPVHDTRAPGVADPVVFDLDSNLKVTFDSIERINVYFFGFHGLNGVRIATVAIKILTD